MEYTRSGHGVYYLRYHVVWTTKYRRKVLKPGVQSYLRKVMPTLLDRLPGVTMETIGFGRDHAHLVLIIPPKYAIADVMGVLKSQSASRIRAKFSWLGDVYWAENVFWSPGYFVSSVGVSEEKVKRYVDYQEVKDSDQKQRKLFL